MDMPVEKKIIFELNGRSVEAIEGETILEAADRIGVEIPRLCYKEGIRADGNCRACVVEIDGERALAPSCCRYPTDGMKVTSNEGKARHSPGNGPGTSISRHAGSEKFSLQPGFRTRFLEGQTWSSDLQISTKASTR